jgi:nitroreductase / dihydropteridine reductase
MNILTTPSTQILDSLNWRYATKSFDTNKKLSDEQLSFVKETLRLAPSSYGIQAWKFVEIKTPEIRQKLKEAGWNQSQFTESSSLFALCTYVDPVSNAEEIVNTYVEELISQRGVTAESLDGYKNMMINAMKNGNTMNDPAHSQHWLDNQMYIALGQAMTACAIAGIDTCPMEGFDVAKANEILDVEKLGLKVNCFLAVGFRNADDKYATTKKVRNSVDKVFLEV